MIASEFLVFSFSCFLLSSSFLHHINRSSMHWLGDVFIWEFTKALINATESNDHAVSHLDPRGRRRFHAGADP